MRTIKYKTLIGLLNQTKQMTIEQFLNGRFHHNTKLSGEAFDYCIRRFNK